MVFEAAGPTARKGLDSRMPKMFHNGVKACQNDWVKTEHLTDELSKQENR